MLSLVDFKKSLGSQADKLTDEEIIKIHDVLDQLSDVLFNMWVEYRSKKEQRTDSLQTMNTEI